MLINAKAIIFRTDLHYHNQHYCILVATICNTCIYIIILLPLLGLLLFSLFLLYYNYYCLKLHLYKITRYRKFTAYKKSQSVKLHENSIGLSYQKCHRQILSTFVQYYITLVNKIAGCYDW